SDEGAQGGHGFEFGVDRDDVLGDLLRLGHDVRIAQDRQVPQRGPAPLRGAEHIALASGVEVVFGQFEPVERGGHGLQPAIAVMDSLSSVSRKQVAGLPSRPTRPRSWWSWATPKFSASTMTIIVA